jgi:para-nitrobenzyl esterase
MLGFLAHPALSAESAQHVSGNYGFLDAVASLQWVKRNIDAFGGDATKVTIGGQSAGSGLVHDLSVSPMGKGLFRGAVAESGTSLASIPVKTLSEAEQDGIEFAKSRIRLLWKSFADWLRSIFCRLRDRREFFALRL